MENRNPSGGSTWTKCLDTRPLLGPFFLIFRSVLRNIWPNNRLAPLLGNPRSAAELVIWISSSLNETPAKLLWKRWNVNGFQWEKVIMNHVDILLKFCKMRALNQRLFARLTLSLWNKKVHLLFIFSWITYIKCSKHHPWWLEC